MFDSQFEKKMGFLAHKKSSPLLKLDYFIVFQLFISFIENHYFLIIVQEKLSLRQICQSRYKADSGAWQTLWSYFNLILFRTF